MKKKGIKNMSYNAKNFSVMAYANGFTLWNYSTEDDLNTVKGSGYFNDIAPFARKGDMILTNAGTASTLEPAVLSVSSIEDGEVSVAVLATPTAAAAA